jgi:hypothetical protein
MSVTLSAFAVFTGCKQGGAVFKATESLAGNEILGNHLWLFIFFEKKTGTKPGKPWLPGS